MNMTVRCPIFTFKRISYSIWPLKKNYIQMKHLLIVTLFARLLFSSPACHAHPRHTDPVLAELNEYLMALQLLRANDPKATAIFNTWSELREASWKIRELTDDENLTMIDDAVMEQIGKTKMKRQQLLQECRAYFAAMVEDGPALKFTVDKSIRADWNNPMLEVPVQHVRILVIELKNQRKEAAEVTLRADASDEILFWNKSVLLNPKSTRYTFAVCKPLSEKLVTSRLQVSDSLGNTASADIQVKGMSTTEAPYTLVPSGSPYKVALPTDNETVAGQPVTFDKSIRFTITDKQTGNPIAARIEVKDNEGKSYWSPLKGPSYAVGREGQGAWHTLLWDHQPGPYFYVDGKAELGVDPVGKTATIYHGFEYKPVIVNVPRSGEVQVSMERWIDMPERGWYSGHTHIHTTDVGIPVQFSRYWPIVSQGEDLHMSAILTLKGEWETHAIYADEYPMGKRDAFSTSEHITFYGEEFRNNPYGHLAFLGLKELIQPISTGALGELGGPDYPPNSFVLDEALAQGATTISAHFGIFSRDVPQIKTPWHSTGFEMPVDVALGKIHMAELAGNGGQQDVWYDILNCGFRVAATAGPDWFIKDTPRVYVDLGDKPFTLDNWREGLQAGNSFITNGPMLSFSVNGQAPGSELKLQKGPVSVTVAAEALMPDGPVPVEIVYNGKVIGSTSEKNTNVTLADSGWLAIRCGGAHSNPVYVSFEGRPAGYAEPARKFIGHTERLEEWVQTKGLFDSDDQKQLVLAELRRGKAVYQEIIERAERMGRKLEE